MVAACNDDASQNLSEEAKAWFESMGSEEIRNLKFRESFVFIGFSKRTGQANEKRSSDGTSVSVTQILPRSVSADMGRVYSAGAEQCGREEACLGEGQAPNFNFADKDNLSEEEAMK